MSNEKVSEKKLNLETSIFDCIISHIYICYKKDCLNVFTGFPIFFSPVPPNSKDSAMNENVTIKYFKLGRNGPYKNA
jgi:hypothetical protein